MPHIYLLEFSQTTLLVEETLMIFLSILECELVLKIILFKVRKKIRRALKITERPHSHQNELEYFKSSQLVFIATGFMLFSSLDSKYSFTLLCFLHHWNSVLTEFPSYARKHYILHWVGLEMDKKRHRTSSALTHLCSSF